MSGIETSLMRPPIKQVWNAALTGVAVCTLIVTLLVPTACRMRGDEPSKVNDSAPTRPQANSRLLPPAGDGDTDDRAGQCGPTQEAAPFPAEIWVRSLYDMDMVGDLHDPRAEPDGARLPQFEYNDSLNWTVWFERRSGGASASDRRAYSRSGTVKKSGVLWLCYQLSDASR